MMKKLAAFGAVALLLCAMGSPRVPSSTGSAAASLVVRAGPGVLWGFSVTTGATGGYVMLFDAVAAPSNGTVTPVKCYQLGANSSLGVSWDGPPAAFNTGITIVFSSTGCFTQTTSATAFISAESE